ncbi:2-methylcitrate dehydratase PrpD [Scopulibacillus darangshiensis]|uniref:2-methylcitrate dehydratase PrpD n=1 Tax=Scopulibacillus darangshiensis TaxID=442528 RepID=A0A4R2P5T1_9BACL|nr:MmgE/PrpD family protein [Scopulibacillus darangshiensis]TCP29484.1 2-methylcitrate dehydratase PrpD [Scopulibacillus darangshiensis]
MKKPSCSYVSDFIRGESLDTIGKGTLQALKEALADIIACTIAGSSLASSRITYSFSRKQYGSGSCSILGFPEKLTPAGATLVNATMANALDIDDGHRLTKGHPGAVIFPAVLAAAEEREATVIDFLTALLIGYEIGIRAGIAAHHLRSEYHCTGSWGVLGAAAGVSRLLKLTPAAIENALGIAEYHATYSPMMRCIAYPSMVKDAIGWGSMTGISSAYLAEEGFSGIPSLFTFKESNPFIQDLGNRYRIRELYYKPFACCRWAQPAVQCIETLVKEYKTLSPDKIDRITIYTFRKSADLSTEIPKTTEEAQYNLTFPIAAFLVFGAVGPKQVTEELGNRDVLKMMEKIEVKVDPDLEKHFPEKALSRVELETIDGRKAESPIIQAKGDFDYPLTLEEKQAKFIQLTAPSMGSKKARKLYKMISEIEKADNLQAFIKEMEE